MIVFSEMLQGYKDINVLGVVQFSYIYHYFLFFLGCCNLLITTISYILKKTCYFISANRERG